MKVERVLLKTLRLPVVGLVAIPALCALLVGGCEDRTASETTGDVISSEADEVSSGYGSVGEVRYPEFERQERVERIAALPAAAEGGEAVYQTCATCHGQEGFGSRDGEIPRLAGQQPKVLIEKLVEISDGERHRPEMEPYLALIDSDGKIGALAGFISALPDPDLVHQGTGESLALGETLFGQYCISCHGPVGAGDGEARVPRIAGWDYASVRRTLIRQGAERGEIHETGMSDLVSMFDEAEINALSDHVSRLVIASVTASP